MDNTSEYVTLVQLIDSLGNVNHAVSVVENWYLDSNGEKALPLVINSLNLMCRNCSMGFTILVPECKHRERYVSIIIWKL